VKLSDGELFVLSQALELPAVVAVAGVVLLGGLPGLAAELHDQGRLSEGRLLRDRELPQLPLAEPVVVLLCPRAVPEPAHDFEEPLSSLVVGPIRV